MKRRVLALLERILPSAPDDLMAVAEAAGVAVESEPVIPQQPTRQRMVRAAAYTRIGLHGDEDFAAWTSELAEAGGQS